MSGYTMTYKLSRIQAAETDQVWIPTARRDADKYGVVLLHGATAPNQYADHTRWGSATLPARLAAAGIPCIAGQMGGDTFANDTALARIDAAITQLSTLAEIPSSKVHLIGVSMGAAAGVRYASTYPSKVASFTGIIPLSSIINTYTNDVAGLRASIGTAWGVTYPTALPAGADLVTLSAAMTAIPSRLYYSDPDTSVPVADVTALGTAMGADVVSLGTALGHTEAGINDIGATTLSDWSGLVSFLQDNGA